MKDWEKEMLEHALAVYNRETELDNMLKWCEMNLVYHLPSSGWIIGAKKECAPLAFEELFSKFTNEQIIIWRIRE